MKPQALVFDFDGTLSVSEPVHALAWYDLARDWKRSLPEDFIEAGPGHTDWELAELLAQKWGVPGEMPRILDEKRRHYWKRAPYESLLVPGAAEMLESFAAEWPLALATSASHNDINPTLDRFNIRRFFKSILAIEDVAHPKPHPEIYLRSAQNLGADPHLCIAFEDTNVGATAARAAGMRVIGLTTTFEPEEIGPLLAHIDDYGDLQAVRKLLS